MEGIIKEVSCMKVLVVDDHPMVRKGLASTLVIQQDVKDVKEAACIEEAIELMSSYNPDILLIDLMLGKEDGLELVTKIKKKELATKCVILTSSSRREDFMRAQEQGVDGYILKEAFPEDIIYALRVVARGKKFVDPDFLRFSLGENKNCALDELTPREKEVLLELGKGLTNNQIAKSLYISENTVKKHISSILAKLGLHQRIEAALYINSMNINN